MNTADTRSDKSPRHIRIFFCHIQFCICYSHFSCCYGKLGVTVHMTDCFSVSCQSDRIKILNFSCNFYGKISGIKLGNRPDSRFSRQQIVPKFLFSVSYRRNHTESRNYYASFHYCKTPHSSHYIFIYKKSSISDKTSKKRIVKNRPLF